MSLHPPCLSHLFQPLPFLTIQHFINGTLKSKLSLCRKCKETANLITNVHRDDSWQLVGISESEIQQIQFNMLSMQIQQVCECDDRPVKPQK